MAAEILPVETANIPRVLAATRVGVWQRDPVRGVIHCNATMCALYGLTRMEGRRGVTLERLRSVILPKDRELFDRRDQVVLSWGGLLLMEYRIQVRDGPVRWILVRGVYEPLRQGWLIPNGRGIIIDITESRECGGAAFLRPDVPDEAHLKPIHRAIDHALASRAELDAMDEAGPGLCEAADLLLVLLARQLAREMPREMLDE